MVIVNSIGQIMDRICDPGTLDRAASIVCSHRKDKEEVARFLMHRDEYLQQIHNMLVSGTFRSSPYRMFYRMDTGKVRFIANLPVYPDRIVQTAICLVTVPLIEPKLMDFANGSRPNHGTHSAVMNVYKDLGDPDAAYALVCDIKQCYPSMEHQMVKDAVDHHFRDKRFRELVHGIIDDYPYPGIPPGNPLSPFLFHIALNGVMHRMAEVHHVHMITTYADNFVILGYSKPWLHRIRKVLESELSAIGLHLKEDWQVFPIDSRPIDFAGYVIYRDHILLRRKVKKRLKEKSARIQSKIDNGEELTNHDIGCVYSYNGVLKWCDGYKLRAATIGPIIEHIEHTRRARPEVILDE